MNQTGNLYQEDKTIRTHDIRRKLEIYLPEVIDVACCATLLRRRASIFCQIVHVESIYSQ
jgi:hypothetical protein